MRIYRMKVKKNGEVIQIKNWYCDCWFRAKKYKLPLFKSLSESEKFAAKLDSLVGAIQSGQSPDAQIQGWLGGLPPKMIEKLARIGLVSQGRVEAAKDLQVFIDEYKTHLQHKGDCALYVARSGHHLESVFDGCGFRRLADVDSIKMQKFLVDKVQAKKLFVNTANNYRQTIRSFFNWLVENDRIEKNPAKHLKAVAMYQGQRLKIRRPLSAAELSYLLDYVRGAGVLYRLSGTERACLYLLAVTTGLRANELRTLTVGDFDAKAKQLTLQAKFAKNKKSAVIPLRADVVSELQELTRGKLPTLPIFSHISYKTAETIRLDIAAAKEAYKRSGGQDAGFLDPVGVDFHGLRHTFATLLVNSNVSPKTAQSLMRHSTIRLTMDLYGHSYKALETAAIEGLPSFEKLKDKQG